MDNMKSAQSSIMVVSLQKSPDSKILEQLKSSSGMDDTTAFQTIEDLRILARILLSANMSEVNDEKIVNMSLTIKNLAA